MAEERQIGIPQEPLDYSSDLSTKPYELDENKKYDDQKHEVISNKINRTVIGDNWRIPQQFNERQNQLGQVVAGLQDTVDIDSFMAKEYIKWRTDPAGAAGGFVAGATLMGIPGLNIAAGGGALMMALEKSFPKTFDLKPEVSKKLTRSGLEDAWGKEIEKETKKVEQARLDLDSGKISQVQFDAIQKNFDNLVSRRQTSLEKVDKFNATVESLNGQSYPNKKMADASVVAAVRFLEMRELNKSIEMAQKGIDPESTGYKIANIAGSAAILAGTAYGANYLGRYGLSNALKRITTDVDTAGAAARLATIKPVRSRREAARIGKSAVELATAEMESAQYTWENIKDYIERTGDKTLSEFVPQDLHAFMGSAYGAIAGKIETMGGIENIAAGGMRKLGVGGFWRRVLTTGAEEAVEEGAQSLTEFLSRKIDNTTDKTWGEALEDALNSAAWGGFMGIGFGTIGGVAYRNARKQGVKVLQEHGLSRDTAEKVFDNMVDQITDSVSPQNESVRENIRSKVAAMYEDADMTDVEREDAIDATTDLEMGWLMTEAAENRYAPEESPLLQGVVNEIGYFRTGIPEEVAPQVEKLNNEISDLRRQLREEQAKETPDYDKVDRLESKIEQFFAKLPQDIANLVETNRQTVREMLAEQARLLSEKQSRRKLMTEVRAKAFRAMQKQDETELQKSLKRLEQESKSLEKKAQEEERRQWQEQRKARKAINKLRQKIFTERARIQNVYDLDSDIAIDLLHKAGFTDKQIVDMMPQDLENALWQKVKPTKAERDFVKSKAKQVIDALKAQGIEARAKNDVSDDGSVYLVVGNDVFRIGLTRTGKKHKQAYTANINANAPLEQIIALIKENRGKRMKRAHELLGVESNILSQNKNRGFYIPELRFIGRTQNMDATTLSHEFAHDWLQQFFRHYRSGVASESFMKSWGAVEKALGIPEDAITVPDKASEAFARAYEGWIQNKKDWEKNIAVDDDNRDSLIKTMERYREYLTDVYGDLTNPYFQDAWGEVGELKPELKAWFDMVTLGGDTIDSQVKMGTITPEEASVKKTAQTLNTIVEKSEDKLSAKEQQEIEAVNRMNDTSRYEVKGGNKNALQNRLSSLAQNIDANNIALGRYDTHRDMLEVARQADEFVRTRRDEALDIINGIRPETEGLYASDLYTAMERLAMETNDVELAMELVNSKVATDLAKEWGQRIAGFRNFKGNGEMDVVSQLKALDQKFKKDYDKNGKQQVEQAAQEFEQELSKADSEQDVDSFLNSLECQ